MWADEFLTTLREIESAAKVVGEIKKLGGINVKVKNGNQLKDGWRLQVGEGPERQCIGKSASVVDLAPRIYTIRVRGELSGREVAAENAVLVSGGKVAEVELAVE